MFTLAELDTFTRPHAARHALLHERLRHLPRLDGLSDFEASFGTMEATLTCPACGAEVEVYLSGRDLHRIGWGVPYVLECCGRSTLTGQGDIRVWMRESH